jgi:hypothetical protein
MERFYFIVLSIAVVLLILILTIIGILMARKNVSTFPPTMSQCPDTWKIATDGSSCLIPTGTSSKNVGNIYNDATNTTLTRMFSTNTPGISADHSSVLFSDSGWSAGPYAGMTSTCAQKQWTTRFNLNWDGVSNYNGC